MNDKKDKRRLYGDLAWTWPIISPPEEYVDETKEIIGAINKFSRINVRDVLNLGCGGGHNDFTLKKYFSVISVDLSEDMLGLARKLNPEVEYLQGDMRTIRLEEQFDAVTIFDSINYMRSSDDLQAAFTTAYDHLKPGGVFVTYIEEWTEKFRQNKTTHFVRSKGDIEITLIENSYDPDPEDTSYEHNMIYLIRHNKKLTIETDCHLMGLFPLQLWSDLMTEVGFEIHQLPSNITDSFGEECPTLVGVKSL
jgi:SAM-dependent methyltransferase